MSEVPFLFLLLNWAPYPHRKYLYPPISLIPNTKHTSRLDLVLSQFVWCSSSLTLTMIISHEQGILIYFNQHEILQFLFLYLKYLQENIYILSNKWLLTTLARYHLSFLIVLKTRDFYQSSPDWRWNNQYHRSALSFPNMYFAGILFETFHMQKFYFFIQHWCSLLKQIVPLVREDTNIKPSMFQSIISLIFQSMCMFLLGMLGC